ncbi:MAG: VOC family protein [Bacteriovoracaceae bacterium]|nr:VOC family protein [Bacteriovoracaceae bacterium]
MDSSELGFFSIPVNDMRVSKKFYLQVMGWNFETRDLEFSYIFGNGKMLGALEKSNDLFAPAASGPLMYFQSASIGTTLEAVVSGGGKVFAALTPIEDGERGFSAKVLDPSGNKIAFWSMEK